MAGFATYCSLWHCILASSVMFCIITCISYVWMFTVQEESLRYRHQLWEMSSITIIVDRNDVLHFDSSYRWLSPKLNWNVVLSERCMSIEFSVVLTLLPKQNRHQLLFKNSKCQNCIWKFYAQKLAIEFISVSGPAVYISKFLITHDDWYSGHWWVKCYIWYSESAAEWHMIKHDIRTIPLTTLKTSSILHPVKIY